MNVKVEYCDLKHEYFRVNIEHHRMRLEYFVCKSRIFLWWVYNIISMNFEILETLNFFFNETFLLLTFCL